MNFDSCLYHIKLYNEQIITLFLKSPVVMKVCICAMVPIVKSH